MIDYLITVIYFCYVTPPSDWDTHSPNRLSASILSGMGFFRFFLGHLGHS